MRKAQRPALSALAVLAWVYASMTGATANPLTGKATLTPRDFSALPGWSGDDHLAAVKTFLKTCAPLIADAPALRSALPPPDALRAICTIALNAKIQDKAAAQAFFERHFQPHCIAPVAGGGFITGYYEPEVEGARTRSGDFSWPLRARPDNLVTLTPETALKTAEGDLVAALREGDALTPVPDRAAIEQGALEKIAPPLVYVRDETEALLIHIQGSTRIRLPDGKIIRLAYAGRNGYPFTSPARLIVQEHGLTPEDVTLEKFKSWLRNNGDLGRDMIRRNRSYIFFRIADELSADDGPVGGAGIPLSAGRSLAIDRTLWSYGLPFFIHSTAQGPDGNPVQRLMVAQDTGSAILGPARGDVFFGSGADMGVRAGDVRHPADFYVLLPR